MMVSGHPSSTRASLSTLPTEILTIIVSHVNSSSAASLSRVARRFAPLCESAIWQEIRLSLNPQYGELPLVQPFPRDARADHEQWAKAEAKLAEDRRREGLREKVKIIMVEASRRRLGMVKKVVVVPRPGALVGILAFLDMVSPTLQVLELQGPVKHCFQRTWRPTDYETLDVKILDINLNFSSLTHLIIRKGSIRFPDFVAVLCRAAPDLISLDVDIVHDDDLCAPDWEDSVVPDYPVGQSLSTKLRELRLAYSDIDDGVQWVPNDLQRILLRSPLLERVSVRYYPDDEDEAYDEIIDALAQCPHLTELYLRCGWYELEAAMCRAGGSGPSFPALRRLCLTMYSALDFLGYFPHLPLLETLILEHVDCEVPKAPNSGVLDLYPSPTMLPDFAAGLEGSPKLRHIYSLPRGTTAKSTDVLGLLNDIETSGTLTGIVSSLHHNGRPLVHARILLHHYELPDNPSRPTKHNVRFTYTAANGAECEKLYKISPRLESAWQDYIGYDGLTVPRQVLEEMRVAAGAGIGDWEGRRVAVGGKAWAVLTEWRDAQLVLQDGEGASGSEAGSGD